MSELEAIRHYGLYAVLALLIVKELVHGGVLTVGFVKSRRRNGDEEAEGKKGKTIVICPLDRTGTVEKINSMERHDEEANKLTLKMVAGITEMNKNLEAIVKGQSEVNGKLTRHLSEIWEELRKIPRG